jgi:pantothenate kinase
MKIELEINGFKYEASFTQREIDEVYLPLLKKLKKIREEKGERVIVFLAAPPAVGKSTLALFLEKLSETTEGMIPVQNLSLDGFHYSNEYLKNNQIVFDGETHFLYEIKGMPETFDLENFKRYLQKVQNKNIKWPIYDRNLHDPVMDQVDVNAEIVIIEGNWLLLDEPGWKDLKSFCDYSIFIEAEEELLKDRLVGRKMKGGLTNKAALEFYNRSDRKNIHRVMKKRVEADLVLQMLDTGEKIIKTCRK